MNDESNNWAGNEGGDVVLHSSDLRRQTRHVNLFFSSL